jgi:hypothetical protein
MRFPIVAIAVGWTLYLLCNFIGLSVYLGPLITSVSRPTTGVTSLEYIEGLARGGDVKSVASLVCRALTCLRNSLMSADAARPGRYFSTTVVSCVVRCRMHSLIRGRCLTAAEKISRALSRLLPAYRRPSILEPSFVHFSTL